LKRGRVIHGLRVLGGNGALRRICVEQRIEEVLISSPSFSQKRVEEIRQECQAVQVGLKRMHIQVDPL